MKANNFNLWFRLTVGSAIGAIVYHFSSGRKTEKLRKMVRMRNQIKDCLLYTSDAADEL